MKPGGVLILTTPNAAYIRNRLALLVGRTVHTNLTDWMFGEPHARHAREYTRSELELLVHEAHLELALLASRHFYTILGSRTLGARVAKRLIDRLARWRPSLGPSLVVVARRPQ